MGYSNGRFLQAEKCLKNKCEVSIFTTSLASNSLELVWITLYILRKNDWKLELQ